MKKIVSIIMVVVMVLLIANVSVFAVENAEFKKGTVFEITHHNEKYPTQGVDENVKIDNNVKATSELCDQIEEVTYAEILWFDINKLYVGLPYESVEKVKKLNTIDKIEIFDENTLSQNLPENKLSENMKEVIKTSSPEKSINIMINLSYTPAIYYGFSKNSFQNPQDYLVNKRSINKEYCTTRNQKYYDIIASQCDIKLNEISKFTPSIYVSCEISELEKLTNIPEIDSIELVDTNPVDEPTDQNKEYLFYDRFLDEYNLKALKTTPDVYEELHYEYNGSDVQWALIHASYNTDLWDVNPYVVFDDLFISGDTSTAMPWDLCLGVYVVSEDKFYDVVDLVNEPIFEQVKKVLLELGYAKIIGDMDFDGEITIVDALSIQKCLVNLKSFDPKDCQIDNLCLNGDAKISYISDINKDGTRDIMDATLIQKKLNSM